MAAATWARIVALLLPILDTSVAAQLIACQTFLGLIDDLNAYDAVKVRI